MKKKSNKFEDLMTAVAFAEAGDTDTARGLVGDAFNGRSLTAADAMEAAAFAEEGLADHARRIVAERRGANGRLLVITGDEGFNESIIEHAIGMAERMNYGIAAMSITPSGKGLRSLVGGASANRNDAESAREAFRKKAEERNIPFSYVEKSGDLEKALREIMREFRRIAFIMARQGRGFAKSLARASIPVFYLADT
ncbi:MAG: hypothetical protein HZA20_00105 [Nitrospirae bacterium]|nr:hypothetical protein [Nitrospirota bacterium]